MKPSRITQTVTAWKILIGSLPRGIVAFAIAIAGLSAGLPLAVFFVGLPVLAGMLIVNGKLLSLEGRLLAKWESSKNASFAEGITLSDIRSDDRLKGWKGWLSVLSNIQHYRGLGYGIAQFPISILAFVLAVVIPAVGFGLLLSPIAYLVSINLFSFDLFQKDVAVAWLFPGWSSFQRSWFSAGLGAILLLFLPYLLRLLCGLYARWIYWISGTQERTKSGPA
jgi:hypothetical protein